MCQCNEPKRTQKNWDGPLDTITMTNNDGRYVRNHHQKMLKRYQYIYIFFKKPLLNQKKITGIIRREKKNMVTTRKHWPVLWSIEVWKEASYTQPMRLNSSKEKSTPSLFSRLPSFPIWASFFFFSQQWQMYVFWWSLVAATSFLICERISVNRPPLCFCFPFMRNQRLLEYVWHVYTSLRAANKLLTGLSVYNESAIMRKC